MLWECCGKQALCICIFCGQPALAQSCSYLPHCSSVSTLTLCTQPQVFFGHDDKLKTIVELIFCPHSQCAACTIILGPGGVRKTSLACTVLTHERVMYHFGNLCYLIPCKSLTWWDVLLVALANSLLLCWPTHSRCAG